MEKHRSGVVIGLGLRTVYGVGHDQPDFYEILGVARTATPEEITQAYRKAMKAVHPDASGTSGLFRLVKTAYDTLKDPRERAAYDSRQRARESGPEHERPTPPPPREEPTASRTESANAYEAPAEAVKEPEKHGALRVRPRFGAHWFKVAGTAVWTVASMGAVYACWPTGLPASLILLLLLPVAAAPIISGQYVLRSMVWPWGVCLIVFSGTALLTALAADPADIWPYGIALAGLLLGGLGLAAAPTVLSKGREMDRLVDRESLDYQIFNVAGAGLGDGRAREVARTSADGLQEVLRLEGTRILHALTPPQLPGHARCYVEHAVMRDRRLALVIVRRWPAATYGWMERGVLVANGQRFPGGDTGITAAVQGVRSVMPRGVQVRGFVSIHPSDPVRPGQILPAAAGRDGFFAGSPEQVNEQLHAWLAEAEPVVDRRVFAALLPHVRRSN